MDHALIVIFALALNLVFGGPRALFEATGVARIARIPAKLLRDQERNFNQPGRHILLIAYTLIIALVAGIVLHYLFISNLKFLEVMLVASLLPVRQTLERTWTIKRSLEQGNALTAKQALDGTVWKHHILLDEYGVARAAIELMAVNASEKILQPILWYMLIGVPGLLVCKVITLMQDALPAPFAAERTINQILLNIPALSGWVCARLASVLWIAASFIIPGADNQKTIASFAGGVTKIPTLPYLLFTLATVLNVSLGGPTSAYVNTQWIGSGTAKPSATDVTRALYMFALIHVLLFVLLGLAI